jgi:radical SAM protein with 4Fe4S-binding SPASM domain
MLISKLFAIGRRIVPSVFKFKLPTLYFDIINLMNYGTTDMFSSVQLETITTCNRKCWYCPNSKYKKPYAIMPTSMYEKVIDQLQSINYKGIFSPHFYGEPLLDKRLPDLISYAREKLPKSLIRVYTNGDFFTEELFMKLINKGVDEFFITDHDASLTKDGKLVEKETFISKFRNGLEKKFQDKIILYKLDNKTLNNRAGLVEVKAKKKERCDIRAVIIDHKGNVLLCCQDYFTKHSFGNINDIHVKEIWDSKNFKSVRQKLRRGIFEFDICKKCLQN